MPVALRRLESELSSLLKPEEFSDYCPNGLQVEGKENISKLVSGVTASQELIAAAIEAGADALLVHHGYFWRGEDPRIVGMKRQRIEVLLEHGVSLFAYHLPLDVHPEFGNNVQLARLLDIEVKGVLDEQARPPVVFHGQFPQAISREQLATVLQERLGRPPICVPGGSGDISSIAWCTGAGQNFFSLAADAGVDAYLTGEISEPSAHIARESGVHFFSAGHHATERYGVQALGNYLAELFALDHRFIDIDNPA